MAPLAGTEWRMASLGEPSSDAASRPPSPDERRRPTVSFTADRVHGFGGCNRFNGTYESDGTSLTIGPLMTTLMACPEPIANLERELLAALGRTASVSLENDTLRLLDATGAVTVTFERVDRFELAGTAWSVVAVNNGRGGVVSVLPDSTLTMAFGPDGSLSGSTGCNLYRARYVTDPDAATLRISDVASTRKACPDNERAGQEQAFVTALSGVTSFTADRGRLELRDAGGALQISLEPSAEQR